jgi:hypothetical protein
MKKFLLSLLAIMMIFAFVACENPAGGKDGAGTNNGSSTESNPGDNIDNGENTPGDNTDNNDGEELDIFEAAAKECIIDIKQEEFVLSAGTWDYKQYLSELDPDYNITGIFDCLLENSGTEPDSVVKLSALAISEFWQFASKEAYETYLENNGSNVSKYIKDAEKLTFSYTYPQEVVDTMSQEITYSEFLDMLPSNENYGGYGVFMNTNSTKNMYTITSEDEKHIFVKR